MRRSSRPPFLEGKRFAGAVAVKETPEPGGRRAAPVATLLGNNCTLPNGASPTLQSPPMGWIEEFPGNFVWSNATLVTKGMAPYGAVALGDIDEVCERLRARQGEPKAWTEEWSAMGRRLEAVADAAAAEGRAMTAGNYAGRLWAGAHGRRLRRHGQLQGDERAVRGPRVRGARLAHARDRRARAGRVA